jgi:hypothetical protein
MAKMATIERSLSSTGEVGKAATEGDPFVPGSGPPVGEDATEAS